MVNESTWNMDMNNGGCKNWMTQGLYEMFREMIQNVKDPHQARHGSQFY